MEKNQQATYQAVHIDGEQLSFDQFSNVVLHFAPVTLSPHTLPKMEATQKWVQQLIAENRIVYGITTGFGKFSDQSISKEQVGQLQLHLIKSHACGVGEPLDSAVVRGMLLLRANALAKGYSGVRPVIVERLLHLLNHQIHPIIPSQGSLGASGDLAPLAHMSLALLGLGQVQHLGEIKPALRALEETGVSPLTLEAKEGLALINGTQMMCSLATLCVIATKNLLYAADIIAAITMDALRGIPQAFHPLLQQVRGHQGQITTAHNLRLLLQNSCQTTLPGERRVQDAYSLRCIPQVHGASKDAYHYVAQLVQTEMNAATDNPLLFTEIDEVISGGNFHGQPLALASDFLSIALCEIGNISERRTERLVNPHLSNLPAFLTSHGGLHSGYMIFQYVAAALVSENKTLAHPASVDSIPSSANQEDHVSMGSIAARKCWRILQHVSKILAIEYICAAQALEFSKYPVGKGSQIAYDLIRTSIPPLTHDREGSEDIEAANRLIQSGQLVQAVRKEIPLLL